MTQLLPLLVPNTDVVIVTERRHITKVGGTKEQPLIWIKGIARAFVLANSKNLPNHANNTAIVQPIEKEIPRDAIHPHSVRIDRDAATDVEPDLDGGGVLTDPVG